MGHFNNSPGDLVSPRLTVNEGVYVQCPLLEDDYTVMASCSIDHSLSFIHGSLSAWGSRTLVLRQNVLSPQLLQLEMVALLYLCY